MEEGLCLILNGPEIFKGPVLDLVFFAPGLMRDAMVLLRWNTYIHYDYGMRAHLKFL